MGYRGVYEKSISIVRELYARRLTIFIAFIVLTFLIPARRGIPEDKNLTTPVFWLFEMHLWLPLLLTVFVALRSNSPSLNKAASIPFWNVVTLIVLPLLVILTVTRIPGLWWTWVTLGTHLATMMIVANLLRGEVRDLYAITIGVGAASFAAGSWEMVYQLSYYYHYDVPQGIAFAHIENQLIRVSPLMISGLGILIAFGHIKKVYLPLVFGTYTILAFGLWVYGYMWVDIYYNWTEGRWLFTDRFNWSEAILYRSTKASLALTLITLYSSKGIRLRYLIGYVIIIPWTLMFLATTAFLGFTWVKSLFAKEGKPPYFKTRSIHYDRQYDLPEDGGRN